MPGTAEDYVHRIGRCGRAGAVGVAYALFTTANARLAKQLAGILDEAQQPVPSELRMYMQVSGGSTNGKHTCCASSHLQDVLFLHFATLL